MNLGQLIKQKRKEKRLTQGDVAEKIGVSTTAICKYEKNMISNIGRTKIIALSKLLDIPAISFIEAIDEIESHKNLKDLDVITPRELMFEVKELVSKTTILSIQEKEHILSTVNLICSDKE